VLKLFPNVFGPFLTTPHPIGEIVKVPQMAESIVEGTLKTWSKQVGDTVTADEEVATIETDKVRLPQERYIPNANLLPSFWHFFFWL
jgi:hypothetical protein